MLISSYLFFILSVALGYLLLSKTLAFIENSLLRATTAWFLGHFTSVWAIYLLSLILVNFSSRVLLKSSLLWCLLLSILFTTLFYQNRTLRIRQAFLSRIHALYKEGSLLIILLGVILSFMLFKPHLSQQDGKIYVSPVYWDIRWHAPLIQNFAWGDNFPVQNESFSNFPHTYHFFWGLLTAIYSALGMNLGTAINFVSITSFLFLLLGVVGLTKEFFDTYATGIIAVLLTVTSSSLHSFNLLLRQSGLSLTGQTPYFSFVSPNDFGYNGNMFNIFYFIAERQLIVGVIYLIFAATLFYYREKLSPLACILWGALLGLFFEWHLFTTLMAFIATIFFLIFAREKKQSLLLTISFGATLAVFIIYFRSLMKSVWFHPEVFNYPKINFNYPTNLPSYPFSIPNAIGYYLYAYGIKIIFFVVGFIQLFRLKSKSAAWTLASFLPTFVFINTIQISPLSIYDNHKWLRPFNVMIDLVAAYALTRLLKRKSLSSLAFFSSSMIVLTLTGFIELTAFTRTRPVILYGDLNSNLTNVIRRETPPRSSFLTTHQKEVHLAGRKVFWGNYAGGDLHLNVEKRIAIAGKIYQSWDIELFCQQILAHNLDYVEFTDEAMRKPIYQKLKGQGFKLFSGTDLSGNKVTFVSAYQGCQDRH